MTRDESGDAKSGPGPRGRGGASARERILDAAYGLFMSQGVAQVGIDKVIAKSGCAKASLYNQFGSKDGLAIAFLERREELWTRRWLEAELTARGGPPEAQLLAIFGLFDEWFHRTAFEGCSFINVLLESEHNSPVNRAAAAQLAKIRKIVLSRAEAAGLADAERFASIWHMLMKGAIIAASEGNRAAAREARIGAEAMLAAWPRRAAQ